MSVAHLDEEERQLVLGVLLEEVLAWVRTLPGSSGLRALVVFDEVYGFLPPQPSNPATKRPLVALMKQARGFGVGVVVATQNPMDLDYRALGNAGLWWVGKLLTDADRARVVEGMGGSDCSGSSGGGRSGRRGSGGSGGSGQGLTRVIQQLNARWFVQRGVHDGGVPAVVQPRWAMSWLKGPMTRSELKALRPRDEGET